MDGSTTERKRWSPAENTRGPECRRCGCRHWLIVCTLLGGKLVRRGECRHCGRRCATWRSGKCRRSTRGKHTHESGSAG